MAGMKTKTRGNARTGVPADLEVLTLAEAAAYVRVDKKQVRQMVQQGALPGRQIGDDWRFFKAALQAWLSNAAGEKERLMELAGAWKDDPYLEQIVRQAYQQRARFPAEALE
jgi:excisionase family DNA binding protein